MNKKRKTVLITGAGRGIGAACAAVFAINGYNVAVNYNNSQDKAEKIVNDICAGGGSARAYKADVSDFAAVNEMVNTINADFSAVDVLINNAGVAVQGLFTQISSEQWQHLRNVNIDGTINCCQAVVPQMISRHSGKIINISSIWGLRGASCEVHYSVTKAAIIGLTKALAQELGPCGITVNCIAPGVIKTDMLNCYDEKTLDELKRETPLNRLGTPTDIADCALFLASHKADFITAQVVTVSGGF